MIQNNARLITGRFASLDPLGDMVSLNNHPRACARMRMVEMGNPAVVSLSRRSRVMALSGFTSSALDREIKKGLFPSPIRLSPDPTSRAVGWIESEIAAVNAAKIAGVTEHELRQLVSGLVAARGHREAA
jgi:prophage regulatory protein